MLCQMASIIKLLSLTILLGLVFEANGECSLRNITIAQSTTGEYAHGMQQWSLNITNNCACVQSHVKLNCTGFQTNYYDYPEILSVSGDECLLKSGKPIAPFETVKFLYAWDPPFPFNPISSQISCS